MTDTTTLTPAIELFGAESQLAATQAVGSVSSDASLYSMADFKIVALICFVCYCVMVYYFKGYIGALMKLILKKNYTEKLMEEQGYLFGIFMRMLYVVGIMAWSLLAVKFVDVYFGATILSNLPQWGTYIATTAVVAMVLLVGLYRYLVLRMIGRIGSVFEIVFPVLRLSSLIAGMATIICTPFILLTVLSEGVAQNIGLYVVALEVLYVLFFYFYKSYLLFLEQNVSIFYWFLYLCTVEVFPISLFALIVARNFA